MVLGKQTNKTETILFPKLSSTETETKPTPNITLTASTPLLLANMFKQTSDYIQI